MAAEKLSFFEYVKEAFLRQVPVPGLGGMPLNVLMVAAFGVLGLANPGFWFLGAAVEGLYLTLKGSSARFQKLIEGQRLLAAKQQWQGNVTRALERLTPASRERYRRLLAQCRRILGLADTQDDQLGEVKDFRARSLNQMLTIFLRLLASREGIQENLRQVDHKALEADIRDLEKRLADEAEDTALARSLAGNLEIRKKRLENLDRSSGTLQVIEAELERIEQQVELIREESAVRGGPEALSARLDAVTTTMTETSRWMDAHADLFDPLSPTTSEAPPALPSLPELREGE
jgi:hypothetical protein